MTYYDELGLKRNASTQEIRHAYKVSARLLHPDGQVDQQVRVVAERQMMRLNELLVTLTDPQKRRDYDDSLVHLRGTVSGPGARIWLRPEPAPWRMRIPEWADAALAYWFWAAMAAIILGVGCWYVMTDKPAPAAETGHTPQGLYALHLTAPPAPEPAEALTLPRSVASFFSGNWSYFSDRVSSLTSETYAVSYVEFLLADNHGDLSGSYRARYKIPELAVSPEVLFQAHGRITSGDSAKLDWISPDGAGGVVELTLLGPNEMNVAWWTTQSGPIAAPASGTAKLIRQHAR